MDGETVDSILISFYKEGMYIQKYSSLVYLHVWTDIHSACVSDSGKVAQVPRKPSDGLNYLCGACLGPKLDFSFDIS